jgi:hypothetical protein
VVGADARRAPLAFEGGRVLLTLGIGDTRAALLREQDFSADAVFLDFDGARGL